MTQASLPKTERAAWLDLAAVPDPNRGLLAAALALFSALAFALCDIPTLSMLFLLTAVLFLYFLTRSFLSLLLYALPVIVLTYLTPLFPWLPHSLLPATAFLSLLMGGVTAGYLFFHFRDLRKFWYFYTLPVIAWGAVALLARDPFRGLLALLPLLLGAVFALALYFYLSHNDAILFGVAAMALALTLAGLITLALMGRLGEGLFTAAGNAAREAIVTFFSKANALTSDLGLPLLLSDVDLANIAATTVNLLPALFVIALLVLSYLAWRTLLLLFLAWDRFPFLPRRLAVLSISPLCAVLFVLSYLISLFANAGTVTMFGTVCQNFALILELPLALTGMRSLFGHRRQRSCLSALLAIALIFSLFINPLVGIALAAFLGAFHVLASLFASRDEKGE